MENKNLIQKVCNQTSDGWITNGHWAIRPDHFLLNAAVRDVYLPAFAGKQETVELLFLDDVDDEEHGEEGPKKVTLAYTNAYMTLRVYLNGGYYGFFRDSGCELRYPTDLSKQGPVLVYKGDDLVGLVMPLRSPDTNLILVRKAEYLNMQQIPENEKTKGENRGERKNQYSNRTTRKRKQLRERGPWR